METLGSVPEYGGVALEGLYANIGPIAVGTAAAVAVVLAGRWAFNKVAGTT